MSYKLEKPYTEEQYADFVVEHNHNNGRKIEETETALFALEANEILEDGQPVINPNYEEEQAQIEQARIDRLTMTALDFIGVLQNFGLTLEQINAYLESHLEVKMQLTYCQNVYCGVAKSLMPITFEDITITADMVEIAFRVKNGEDFAQSEGQRPKLEVMRTTANGNAVK